MRSILKFILKILTKATVAKYHPLIVGVTGSVGKTSTKQAVAAILQKKYTVGQTDKNFNNEIGLPLAVLRANDSGYKKIVKWLQIILASCARLLIKDKTYPECLVLEMGIDHKGDMDYLLTLVKPTVGVLTAVSEVHLEYLGNIQGVVNEKAKLLRRLPPDGLAVFNGDQLELSDLQDKIKAKVLTFGFKDTNNIWADGLQLSKTVDGEVRGYSFKLHHEGSVTPLLLPDVLGAHQVLIALAAAAIGIGLGVNVVDIAETLKSLHFPSGRMKLISGIKNSKLIDDSYNSSPLALKEALKTLAVFPAQGKKWAVLGDMLELGLDSEELHQECGRELVKNNIDKLITVGERSRDIGRGALKQGLSENDYIHFGTHVEAGNFLKDKISEGDAILIKGSQGARMEKITKELMAEPQRAKELLVRQYKPWV